METGVRRVASPTASWGDGLMEGKWQASPLPLPWAHPHRGQLAVEVQEGILYIANNIHDSINNRAV